jgi:hypothetical protein
MASRRTASIEAIGGMEVRRARALALVLAPPLERACAAAAMDFTHSHRQLLLQHSSVGFVEPPSKIASHADPRARLLQLASFD